MSKEYLEALAKNIRYKKEYIENDTYRLYIKKNEIELLEKELQRLESIDNANPSEALGSLEWMGAHRIEFSEFLTPIKDISEYNTIKQYILKAQEQEKILNHERELNNRLILKTREQQRVLSIIFKKGLPLGEIAMIKQSANYNEYNIKFSWANFKDISIQKTEEEFDILKEYANEITRVKD